MFTFEIKPEIHSKGSSIYTEETILNRLQIIENKEDVKYKREVEYLQNLLNKLKEKSI
ncbi:MAG: hypothetical protein PHU54_09480 [Candidatus Omnitrophica bacterium]|jgi:hypothetical protein|nr:hypothetical protein [Candidatus Omnitrophota bacterium]